MDGIQDLCKRLSERRINSKKFGEALQLDGRPLWYFLRLSFPPKPFKSWREIDEAVNSGRVPSRSDNLKTRIFSFAFRKGLVINEKIKLLISKRGKAGKIEPGKKDVLFLGFTNKVFERNGELDFFGFGDVANALKRKKIRPLVLICDSLSNPFFKLRKYSISPYTYMDSGVIRESRSLSRKLHQKWKKLEKSELFTFQGKDYWKFLKNEMNFLFSQELLFILIKYYLTFKKIIEKHDIKLVYITGVGIHELALLAAARKLNRGVMYSPHGYGLGPEVDSNVRYEDVLFLADGEERRKRSLKSGIKDENIFVTGSPSFDKIARYKQKKVKRRTKTITLLTTTLVEDKLIRKREYFKLVRKTLVQIVNAKNVGKIIIKLHPREKYKSEYESLIKSLNLRNVKVIQNSTKDFLYSVLSNSNLIVSFTSTADVEGLMLDKNVINIEVVENFRKVEYKKVTVKVEKDDDLTKVINKVLSDEKLQKKLEQKRERYLKESFGEIDGKASKRIADLIEQFLFKSNRKT